MSIKKKPQTFCIICHNFICSLNKKNKMEIHPSGGVISVNWNKRTGDISGLVTSFLAVCASLQDFILFCLCPGVICMLAPSNVPLLEARTSPAASPMDVSFPLLLPLQIAQSIHYCSVHIQFKSIIQKLNLSYPRKSIQN